MVSRNAVVPRREDPLTLPTPPSTGERVRTDYLVLKRKRRSLPRSVEAQKEPGSASFEETKPGMNCRVLDVSSHQVRHGPGLKPGAGAGREAGALATTGVATTGVAATTGVTRVM